MKLPHRITLQQLVAGQDSAGQPVQSWSAVTPGAWADIRHLSGLSSIKAGADVAAVKTSIRIRYRTDLTAGMRALHGATVYDIQAVLPDLVGKQHTDLVCTTGANNG